MIDEPAGPIEYEEHGGGGSDAPTVVMVPGSCSTGAAWRPVIAALGGHCRCVTTSLLGYGGTAERRSSLDASICHEAAIVETVVRRAGGPVHLVGHSFGGLVGLAVALRGRVPLASLTIAEAPAPGILRELGEAEHYGTFRRMSDAYAADFQAGNAEAIAAMIDFYGGQGTYAGWPERVRAYAVRTTPSNLLDWASAYGCRLPVAALAALDLPALALWGGDSHPAARRANELLGLHLKRGRGLAIPGAAHFMIATHPQEVARAIRDRIETSADSLAA
ncbi:alpha/beta fold hydrolase [Desertibaculum subflavum]|uniref:alpha/beta fold hydrolase n=1 Tax=Desertibaculum subflavum TaxID=2268458 RepID=UPI000E66DCD2